MPPVMAGGGVRADVTAKALREKKVRIAVSKDTFLENAVYYEPGRFKSAGLVVVTDDEEEGKGLAGMLNGRTRYGVLRLAGCKDPDKKLASWLDGAVRFFEGEKMVHSRCIVPVCRGKAAKAALEYAADEKKSRKLAGLILVSPELEDEKKLRKTVVGIPVLVVNGGKLAETLKGLIDGKVADMSGEKKVWRDGRMSMAILSWLASARRARVAPSSLLPAPKAAGGIRPADMRTDGGITTHDMRSKGGATLK
jgi:hypothetical protein